MEKFFEKSEIKSIPVQLFIMSFIRVVMEDVGRSMDEGIILIADDMPMAKHFVKTYIAKARNAKVIGRKMPKMENYQLGFKLVSTGMKEEQAEEFLGREDFLPVLITGGVLPSYLRTTHNFFRIQEQDIRVLDNMNFQFKIQGLKKYIIDNINILENIYSTEKAFDRAIEYVENLLFWYLKTEYELSDIESTEIAKEMETYGEKLMNISDDILHANREVREEIQIQMKNFVLKNQNLQMLDINAEIDQIRSKDTVIWFDDEYYYLTDAMFRKACEKVLEVVSVNELKAILREEGILYCDASGDYSIKIIVKTQNGKQRPRVLKLRKLYLTVDGECLEDIYRERMENNNV